jgi:predicted tellurium resistance membrane protein TerC
MSFELLTQTETYVSLLTLTVLEVVLGIDNVVFISILVGKLPAAQQARARRIGLGLAMFMRVGLLLAISWVLGLTRPLFTVFSHEFAGRDLIMLGGGLFLVAKATQEIYEKLEVQHEEKARGPGAASFGFIIAQIVALDAVFSLDSVITAVGLAQETEVMIAAVVIAVGVMLLLAGRISDFVNRHPSMKILALSFLLLIGVVLIVEAFGQHVGKGYIYLAMAFSLGVELLNMRFRAKSAPVPLHHRFEDEAPAPEAARPGA